jgi:glycine hydroxymethyltransferase
MAASDARRAEARDSGFFTRHLDEADPEISQAIKNELHRQQDEIELIASENIVSQAVLDAAGTLLTNKYAEGYPGKRYYGGCQYVDVVEQLAIDRAERLFNCAFANVQPHSGSQANQSVMLALIKPGDTVIGMSLAHGGHLTHGAPPNLSGKWFNAVQYGVRKDDNRIDYDEVERLAKEHKPALIIAGGSAYPRIIDFPRFRAIADSVGAYLMVDMAHFAGLVAAGLHPSPLPYAHVVTTTTHKTLRGPRAGMVLSNDEDIGKKINSAVFPGLQGGPLMHIIAAKALGETLVKGGVSLVSGGTDTHLMLVDLRPKKLTGKAAEIALGRANITCNKNGVPFDPEKPMVTSGIRLGSPAGTTRGFGIAEFQSVGNMIIEVLDGLAANGDEGNAAVEASVKQRAKELCGRYPIYR